MEKQSTEILAIPPLAWAAGIAILLFSLTGIAVLMGWIPNSIAVAGAAFEARSAPLRLPATSETRVAPDAPVRQAEAAPRRPAVSARPVPQRESIRATARCEDCGVIESIRVISAMNEGAGEATFPDGTYGTRISARQPKAYAVTVRLEDGTSRVFSETDASGWHAGDKVRIVNGAL